MRFQDFRNVSERQLQTDLCIVGSGPAGVALAQEFIGASCRVLMIESGGLDDSPEAAALNAVENVGAPRQRDQTLVRTRRFGGTSNVWSGRCAPLDEIDFEQRAWIPFSGWPLRHADLAPYFHRAADYLGLGRVDYDERLNARLQAQGLRAANAQASDPALDRESLQTFCWQFSVDDADSSVPLRCGPSFAERAAANVRVLLNATVTQINTSWNGAELDSLEISTQGGKKATVRARVVVLCTGGLEIPRLLLASQRTASTGVGNAHGVVGRFMMDHPRCSLGHFELATSSSVQRGLSVHRLRDGERTRTFLRGLALSPALQRKEQLLNCAAWTHEDRAEDDPWSALKRIARRPRAQWRRDVRALLSQPRLTARQIHRRLLTNQPVIHKLARLELRCDVEQTPNPDSRITLSDKKDELGVPLARVDWKIGELEMRTLSRFAQLSIQAFERMKLPVPILNERVQSGHFSAGDFMDVAHPSGAARMTRDPRTGVVDPDCQVHGVDRLYAVGSAIFPTNGHVNPTMTIVALAIRLADRLKLHHFKSAANGARPALENVQLSNNA
jgi:choline dehydrogenase-like flavoprotein